MKYKILIKHAADRDDLVKILAKNGYTVRIGRERSKPGGKFNYFVEYWL